MLGVAGVWTIGDAVLSGSPAPRNPGFVDSLLASGAVLASAEAKVEALEDSLSRMEDRLDTMARWQHK